MMDGTGSFSNMHAAWNANGAHEFIPGAGFKAADFGMQPRQRPEYDPRSYQQHMNQHHMTAMYPPAVGGYPTQTYWPWQSVPDMGLGVVAAPKSAGIAIAPPSKFLVAMWNLNPTYSKELIRNALEEMDVTPVRVRMCLDIPGACLLWCVEEWTANAVSIMLDMTDDVLQVSEGKSVRAVKCPNDLSKLYTPDMPFPLRQTLIQEANQET